MMLLSRCSCLLICLILSLPVSFAQKGKYKTCAKSVEKADEALTDEDWAEADAIVQQGLEAQPDEACKRKLLALSQRLSYVQGQYASAADRWRNDAAAFNAMASAGSMPYPENTGLLFAGMNTMRTGKLLAGGALVTVGMKNTNYNMLRLMKLEEADMHYLLAGLGAGMDTLPAMAQPLIPQVMSRWESGGNKLSVLPDTSSGINYYLGRVLVEYRKWAAAVPFLEKELGKARKHPRATEYLLAKCYNELGQYDKAVALLKPLYEQDKSDWVTLELERAFNGADRRK
jgi:tetratricopeptide (TPR) repeat protein